MLVKTSLFLLFLYLGTEVYAGLVKRDTADDIENKLNDMLGGNDNPLDELKEGKICLVDSNCLEPLQHCNRENPLNPHCQFVTWVYVAAGLVAAFLLLAIFGSCLCCSCCCLKSLCRKK